MCNMINHCFSDERKAHQREHGRIYSARASVVGAI
jgi:hypothetical protein